MDLVLFDDAIGHIMKIHRVITTQSGNAMLVGVGGSGRKSLTELATSIASYEIISLEMKKGYNLKDCRDDMREKLFQASGIEALPHVFLYSDTQMISEAFRRRRVEAASSDRFVERLLGLELGPATYERGEAFVQGVVGRAGEEGLARLWQSERELPTPAEVDAPGLWLARIDLPDS